MVSNQELLARLYAKFAPEEVKTRPLTKDKNEKRVVHYVTARTVMNRLDDVLGPDGWWDRYEPMSQSVICHLTIRLPDGTTITKCDAGGYAGMADAGDDDKSGFSDGFKRAAVKFGVGRYLYRDGVPQYVRDVLAQPSQDERAEEAAPAPRAPAPAPAEVVPGVKLEPGHYDEWLKGFVKMANEGFAKKRPDLGDKFVFVSLDIVEAGLRDALIKSGAISDEYEDRPLKEVAPLLRDWFDATPREVHRVAASACKERATKLNALGTAAQLPTPTPAPKAAPKASPKRPAPAAPGGQKGKPGPVSNRRGRAVS
jgi:Rad52/22 family double-strand break repair protein